MGDFDITFDTREFSKAITDYSAATGKTMAESTNRAMMNLAIHGFAFTRKAEENAIESLESQDWWPKLVAKLLKRKRKASIPAMRKRLGRMSYRTANFSKLQAASQQLYEVSRGIRFYTAQQAKEYSRILVRRRLVAVKFLRFFFVSLADAFKPYSGKGRTVSGKKFRGFSFSVTPATRENLSASAVVSYDYKVRKDKTAKKAEMLLDAALKSSVPETIRDIQNYTQDEMKKDARRFSGR